MASENRIEKTMTIVVSRCNSDQDVQVTCFLSSSKDSFEELRNNVSWTPRAELQRLVVIVLVFSVLFSLAIWGADSVLSEVVGFYFQLING